MIEITHILDVPKHISGLKAVIFDLDDTLYSEKEYVRSGYREIAKLFPEINDVDGKLWALFEQGRPAIDDFLKNEHIYSDELKQQCLSTYRNQVPDIHLYDGVEDMLINLKEKYLLGMITDGRPEGQRAKIRALGLETIFDNIIVTDELGGPEFRKPCPTAFQMMGERLGVNYNHMCYVGDNITKDFIAPGLYGIRGIYYKNRNGIYYNKNY